MPPGLVSGPVEHDTHGTNRLHLDRAPHVDADRDAEIDRLLVLGATRVDVGQGAAATWKVRADPDDSEFCVLSSRES